MSLKISLVIPTRERLAYLPTALASAHLAADRAGAEIEILVADNASADGTAEWLATQRAPRLKVIRSERRLSMRENFQFALENTTGSHLIYIGDDDAVLPHGLALARRMIQAADVDIFKWRVENYHWPDPARGVDGWVKIRPQHLDGQRQMLDPQAVLARFCNADFRTYQEGGMIYHGMVSRRLIDQVVARTGGPYFRGSSPDVFTSMQALIVGVRPIMKVSLPLTLTGASPRSNGAAAQKHATAPNTTETPEFEKFIRESAEDPYQCRLPARTASLILVTLDALTEAARQCGRELSLNIAAWSARAAQEISSFVEPDRSDCVEVARIFFGSDFDIPPTAALPQPKATRTKDEMRRSNAPGRIRAVGGPEMRNALSAADFLDRLTRLETTATRPAGRLSGFARMLRMHGAAARLFDRPSRF